MKKCIQLFCQVRGRATAAVPGLLHFPHGSAAAEGWDRGLVHRVFPSVFSISINTLSLQGWAGTMVYFTCALPAKRIKSGISSHAIILMWKGFVLKLSNSGKIPFQDPAPWSLLTQGRWGLLMLQIANRVFYPLSHLCDTTRGEAAAWRIPSLQEFVLPLLFRIHTLCVFGPKCFNMVLLPDQSYIH